MLFGTKLLLSQLHTSVVIPSYELETSSPFTFWHQHNFSSKNDSSKEGGGNNEHSSKEHNNTEGGSNKASNDGNKTGYVAMMRSAKAEGLQDQAAGGDSPHGEDQCISADQCHDLLKHAHKRNNKQGGQKKKQQIVKNHSCIVPMS